MFGKIKLFLNFFAIVTTVCLLASIEGGNETMSVVFTFLLFGLTLIIILISAKFKPLEKKRDPHDSNKAYIDVFENSIPLAKMDIDFKLKYVNRSFCQLTLSTKEECINKNIDSFLQNQKEMPMEIYETLKQNRSWDGDLMLNTKHDNEAHVKCIIEPIFNGDGSLFEFLLIAHDFTELTISKKIIQDKIYTDSQTKLPNRLQLIKDMIDTSQKLTKTIIILNIDSFQAINNVYGNQIGDEALSATAKWLKKNLPNEKAKLFKFEADVFAMSIPSPYSKATLKSYLEKLSKKISKEGLLCSNISINVTFTIGAAQEKEDLLKLASIAYKVAKKEQKSFWIYDTKSNKKEEYTKNVEIINLIKKGLEKDLIAPYFQPILNIKTKQIDKYETLIRIKKSGNLVHAPSKFLDIAKHSKLYPMVSQDIIGKAFDFFRHSSTDFTVNLSLLDISNKNTIDYIFNKIGEYGIGSRVIFEILESEGINNYEKILSFMDKAKSYGVRIAIDDFGSGYSNFERLVKLQPDFIKIDGGLIKNIDKNEDMKIITQTIVDFSNKLGAKTIAEYVHSKEVFDIISKMGVDFAQGYYIGKPSPYLCDNNLFKR